MVEPRRQLTVILNASAGSARGAADTIEAALREAGVQARICETDAGDIAAAIAREIAAGASAVGVAGGDGTLSTAAAALDGTGVVLVPFPMGTLNHFARRLGLDTVAASARALAAGHTVRVPLGRAGERRFINNASCGFYPHVVRHRERIRPWLGKWPAAVVASARVFLGMRRIRLRLDTPETSRERRVAGLWIGLGAGSFRLPGEDRLPDDPGVLEIVVPHAGSRRRLLALAARVLWRLARRRPPRTDGLEILHAPGFTLEARRALDVALDGEPFRLSTPVHFAIEPQALEVVAASPGDDG